MLLTHIRICFYIFFLKNLRIYQNIILLLLDNIFLEIVKVFLEIFSFFHYLKKRLWISSLKTWKIINDLIHFVFWIKFHMYEMIFCGIFYCSSWFLPEGLNKIFFWKFKSAITFSSCRYSFAYIEQYLRYTLKLLW